MAEFCPVVVMDLENKSYRKIMVELIIENLLTSYKNVKKYALIFLLDNFQSIDDSQKTRTINFCSKYECVVENLEWLLSKSAKIIEIVSYPIFR